MIASVVIVILAATAAAVFIIRKYCCLKRYRDMQHCVLHETVQPNLSIPSPKHFSIIYTKVNNKRTISPYTWQLNLNKMSNLVFIYNTYNLYFFFSNATYRYSELQQMEEQNAAREVEEDSDEVSMWTVVYMAFKIWYLITFYTYTSFSFHRTFWTESCSTIYSSRLSSFLILWLYMAKSITWVI